MEKELNVGDILLYIGNDGEEIGVVKATGPSGIARVGSGRNSVTVQPHSFIEVIKGTQRSVRMAEYLNR